MYRSPRVSLCLSDISEKLSQEMRSPCVPQGGCTIGSNSEESVKPCGRVRLHTLNDVRIGIQRQADVRVAESLLDNLGVYSLR